MRNYYKTYKIPRYTKIKHSKYKYKLLENVYYYSERYKKDVHIPIGYMSDGATGAFDIDSLSWWVHDCICNTGRWSDGTPVTNWQASQVLTDILRSEGRWIRSKYWFWSTWLFGCNKAKQNGMW